MSSFRLRAHIVSFDRHLCPTRLRRDEDHELQITRVNYCDVFAACQGDRTTGLPRAWDRACPVAGRLVMVTGEGAVRQFGSTHSADVGLLVGALGVGRVLGGERVEDELGGGVSIGARAIDLGVQFSMSLPRGVAAANEDPDGLIDDRRCSQICPGVRPGRDTEVLIEREVAEAGGRLATPGPR